MAIQTFFLNPAVGRETDFRYPWQSMNYLDAFPTCLLVEMLPPSTSAAGHLQFMLTTSLVDWTQLKCAGMSSSSFIMLSLKWTIQRCIQFSIAAVIVFAKCFHIYHTQSITFHYLLNIVKSIYQFTYFKKWFFDPDLSWAHWMILYFQFCIAVLVHLHSAWISHFKLNVNV